MKGYIKKTSDEVVQDMVSATLLNFEKRMKQVLNAKSGQVEYSMLKVNSFILYKMLSSKEQFETKVI